MSGANDVTGGGCSRTPVRYPHPGLRFARPTLPTRATASRDLSRVIDTFSASCQESETENFEILRRSPL